MLNKIIRIAVLFAFFVPVFFANATSEAEYKKLSKTWLLNADGSQEYRYQMELTLFTHTAMNGTYGETFVVYNPHFQEVKINSSYTKQKDGNIVKTPANAFVEVLPRNAANAPAYNHMKELVIVHTGLELGATIYLDYTIKSKPGYLPALDVFEVIPQKSPVCDYTLSVITPEDVDLSCKLTMKKGSPSVKSVDGMRHTIWKLHHVPSISQSDFVALANGDIPYLAATTYKSKKAAYDVLCRQFDDESQPNVKSLASKLTHGKSGVEAKIKVISDFVNHQIAANGLSLQQTGYRIRPVAEVLRTVYGTDIEKFNLFLSLLNAAGVKAEPVVTYPVGAEEGLGLCAIKHFYASVENGTYLLNFKNFARPSDVEFGLVPYFQMLDGKSVFSRNPRQYQIKGNYTLGVGKKGVSLNVDENVGGSLLSYFQEGRRTRTEMQNLKVQKGYATYVLPESASAFSRLSFGTLNSRRDANLLLPRLVDETYSYLIRCSDSVSLCTPEKISKISNAAGEVSIAITKSDDNVHVKRSIKLKKQLYTPSEYKNLRELLINWQDANGKTLLFRYH